MKRIGWFSLAGFSALLAVWAALYRSVCIRRVNTVLPLVALTFDDGPNPSFTDQTLSILERHGVKATFFLIGQNILMNPQTVKKVVSHGHEIGNHSFSHPRFRRLSWSSVTGEIEKTDLIIDEMGYRGEKLFRAPYGDWPLFLLVQLLNKNRKNILFDVKSDPPDYVRTDPRLIIESVTRNLKPGSIIELHDGEGTTVETIVALEEIIKRTNAKGFHFVTVSTLLSENNRSDLR